MRESYEIRLRHPADFKVKYRFFSKEEGGRQSLPFQGIRSDFWYEHPASKPDHMFMIHPEFENEDGEIITNNDVSVPRCGTALMWVVDPKMREYHCEKIKVGTTGYFMEGPHRTAECEVIEILGLFTNPREWSKK